jgi:hypothetical protein
MGGYFDLKMIVSHHLCVIGRPYGNNVLIKFCCPCVNTITAHLHTRFRIKSHFVLRKHFSAPLAEFIPSRHRHYLFTQLFFFSKLFFVLLLFSFWVNNVLIFRARFDSAAIKSSSSLDNDCWYFIIIFTILADSFEIQTIVFWKEYTGYHQNVIK